MHLLENENLQVTINPIGAELASVVKKSNQQEYIWQGDPEIWAGRAPVLFPIVGGLKNSNYTHNNTTYSLPKHGFIRFNKDIVLVEKTNHTLLLELGSSSKTFAVYPFHFNFKMRFELVGTTLTVSHSIQNTGAIPMYYSIGAHPAFKCPMDSSTKYEDYFITLEQGTGAPSYKLTPSGLIGSETFDPFHDGQIPLTRTLFANDALIFKNINAKKATLQHKSNGALLSVSFADFPDLGIWAKPDGDFVCIEPWLGYADVATTDHELVNKEGIQTLASNQMHTYSYQISIF